MSYFDDQKREVIRLMESRGYVLSTSMPREYSGKGDNEDGGLLIFKSSWVDVVVGKEEILFSREDERHGIESIWMMRFDGKDTQLTYIGRELTVVDYNRWDMREEIGRIVRKYERECLTLECIVQMSKIDLDRLVRESCQ